MSAAPGALSIADVANLAGVSERTVREWIDTGELRAINVSRSRSSRKPRLRVLDADLQAFFEERAVGVQQPAPTRRRSATVAKQIKRYV